MDAKQTKATRLVLGYPWAVLLLALLINGVALEPRPWVVSLPETNRLIALCVAVILLCVNHTWLMTATELTRVKYRMFATPEEWLASGASRADVPEVGFQALERVHNAHRNTTENTVFFVLLLIPFMLSGSSLLAVCLWVPGFALARLGYTFCYLNRHDSGRGLFMSLGLLAMYGVASYPIMALVV